MSINIPSYYYTDVNKRVKGESWDNINAKLAKADSASRASFNEPHAHLDGSKAAALNKIRNTANTNLSDEDKKMIGALNKVHSVDSVSLGKACFEREVTVMNKSGKPLDYYKFKDCINNMTELDEKQKTTLRNAIITSTESAEGQQQDSTSFGMHISQTNMELKYISEKLVPEKYQKEFNTIADKYTDELSERYTNTLKTFQTSFANSTGEIHKTTGVKEEAKKSLESLNNGTDEFHTSKKYYDDIYKSVDITNDDKLKEGLSSVYANFIKFAGSADSAGAIREVKYLSDKWNAVLSQVNGSNSLKIPTTLNCLR